MASLSRACGVLSFLAIWGLKAKYLLVFFVGLECEPFSLSKGLNVTSLLTSPWVLLHEPLEGYGTQEKVNLQQVLCREKTGELCSPRDDFELAALQLLVAITQICFPPANKKELIARIKTPLTAREFAKGIAGKEAWFDLNHPETPFMQIRGVDAKQPTPMDKLLAGVADGTNKTFMNPENLANGLCGGCAGIALFNTANNCPSMGGGFKGGLRGSTPITQMIKGSDLRQTIWLNVLHQEQLQKVMPWCEETEDQRPNYVDPVKAGETIYAAKIGLARGLLWQPAHFELLPPETEGCCSLCGVNAPLYTGFNKAKFNYTVQGIWPHPLSARTFKIAKGKKEEKFPSFTTTAPGWTHLSRLVFRHHTDKEGQQPAPIIEQAKNDYPRAKLNFVIGGYRNNQATVLERRHEFFELAEGWADHSGQIDHIVSVGLGYKTALRKALYLFAVGIKDKIHGSGVNLCEPAETLYYQQSDQWMHDILADIDFTEPTTAQKNLHNRLKDTAVNIFNQVTQPYRQEPKMLKALALARRSLNKSLAELIPPALKEQ